MSRPFAAILADLEQRDLLDLAKAIAYTHDVTLAELLGHDRSRPFAMARHALWATLYARGHWSFPRLGALFGYDHSTVFYGVTTARARMGLSVEEIPTPKRKVAR